MLNNNNNSNNKIVNQVFIILDLTGNKRNQNKKITQRKARIKKANQSQTQEHIGKN